MAHVPFSRQHTEHDCVPVTLINGLSYLFKREEIPARVVQRIQLTSLDHISSQGHTHRGTTPEAIEAIVTRLNQSKTDRFPVKASFKSEGSFAKLWKHIKRPNTVAAIRVEPSETETYAHYILALTAEDGWVQCFDPGSERTVKDDDSLRYHKPGHPLPHFPRRRQKSNLWVRCERMEAKNGSFAAGEHPEWVILRRNP